MFFYLSKLLWLLAAPANFLLLVLLAGVALLFSRFARAGRFLALLSLAGFFVLGVLPTGTMMLRVLEDRFPVPRGEMASLAGIIVLGGAVDEHATRLRGPIALTAAGDRMTEAVALARRFPQAKLVFTGGSASLLGSPFREAQVARTLFLELGLPAEQLLFESESRNTYENAIFTREIVKPQPGDNWLLVTSAAHMPRAVGIFRKAGFNVTPFPVDYRTLGVAGEFFVVTTDVLDGLTRVDYALREYIGLLAYWWTGRMDSLFPAPDQSLRGKPSR